ncbi:uncharacterized protein LOC143301459 [Babylonia areolata]|uniref:uncharacterized protein LOC143301459 n=1 Tax=Babylonia areolata TaxID=304850 RepID=UPI003FD0521A
MDSDDGGPFSLTPSLTEGGSYGAGNSTSVASQYHVWAAAAATSTSLSSNTTTTLPTHFSPVSPTGHGLYNDHLTLPHPTQSAVDALSMRLSQGDYHSTATDRLSQGDAYHATVGAENGGRHPGNQSDYHDHLVTQERHLGLESYHHISSSSSSSSSTQQQDRLASADYHTGQTAERLAQNDYHSAQQSSRLSRGDYHSGQSADRLVQNDYHATQQSDRLGQGDYHSAQQSDRLGQQEYHVASQSDRLGQLDYSGATAGERLQGSLTKQDYHALGGDQLGQHAGSYHSGQGTQQTSAFHSGQAADRSLAAQADYHSAQVDLDAVSMHTDFDRRHLDVSLLPKDLVDSGQRGSAMDYLTSQTSSRDTLVGLHPDIVGLQREIDLSVGQTISLPQRSAPGDLASTSYALDPATLPRDLSPYNQRDLDRAMLSASDVVAGQVVDGGTHSSATGGVGLHPQDLAGINLTAASRDLVDLTTLARSGAGREDLGRVRDAIHRPRNEIQRALELEVLGSLDSSTASVDLTLNGGSSTKSSSRTYPSASRLATSAKRQTVAASQAADVRLQNPLSAVTVNTSVGAGINFFQLQTSRDPLNIMAMADSSVAGGSSRHNATDFARQQPTEMSRLRRELTTPYTDLGVHHSMLATAAPLPVPAFKSAVDQVFSAHGDLICNDTLTSSRERLYEMMKQQQFCDAVLGTSLHSIKVHKAVLCSASAYLCGVLSQTCMGKSGGRILTVQFKADIPASSLSAFIDYIYQGRIKLVAKSVRDLNIMARCLHMESLKKTSDEMLASMGATNDADIAIPELILLETLVDKLDKECTASLPLPAPSPPPSCSVGVATDPPALSPPTQVEQSCQTEEAPFKDCGCSGARDWRSGGNALRLGGVGSLSLAVNGGCVAGGEGGDSEKPPLSTESKHHAVSDTPGGWCPFRQR